MNSVIEEIVISKLRPVDDFIFGTADLRHIHNALTRTFSYALVIGKKLDYNIIDGISDHPTKEYYDHYKSINQELESVSSEIASELTGKGINSIALKPTLTSIELDTIYSQTLRAPFSHKMAATKAGLGWIGKSGLLITKEFGPRLRLVTILTDSPLKSQKKGITKSRCGSCKLCVEACPAKAITGSNWDVSVPREVLLDPFKCREMCKKMGTRHINADARVCGICVSICPAGELK